MKINKFKNKTWIIFLLLCFSVGFSVFAGPGEEYRRKLEEKKIAEEDKRPSYEAIEFDDKLPKSESDEKEEKIINSLPFNPLVNEEQRKQLEEQDCGIQFSHTISEQIGGQLKAGFRLTDIYDDTNGFGRLHELNIASFVATRAIKE